jgi:hypothetical protein
VTRRIRIQLSKMGDRGFVASVLNDEDCDTEVTGVERSGPRACRLAAQRLRAAAAKFDLLAEADQPTMEVVQKRINATRLPPVNRSPPRRLC